MEKKNSYSYLLNDYPDVISKDQFYRICHVSKKTAKYLLDYGMVPCIDSGKKTRKYQIKIKDVIDYLNLRDQSPECYTAPHGWYRKKNTPILKPLTQEDKNLLLKFYHYKMADYPDVISTKQASEITGYRTSTISKWCRHQVVQNFNLGNRYLIPKVSLLEFMLSPKFRGLKKIL